MSPVNDPASDLHGGGAGPNEKFGLAAETPQYSFFNTQSHEVTDASSIEQLKSSSAAFESFLETGEHDGIWWLHIASPTDDDLDRLSRLLDVHPLTTEDIKTRELREKVELFHNYYFISLRPPLQLESEIGDRASESNIYGIIFRNNVISFTYDKSKHPAHIWHRIKEHQNHVKLNSDWVCYAFMYELATSFKPAIHANEPSDDVVDGFAPLIDRVQAGVEMMEDGVSVTQPNDICLALQSIYKYRKEVTRIHQVLRDKTDVIRCFARHCENLGSTTQEILLYLDDIQDHVLTMIAGLANAEQMLSRSQSKYLGQVSFDATRMRNQTAGVLSRLTVIGGTLVIGQVLTMLFGMNVNVPGENVLNLSWWFGILGFIIGFSALGLVIAKRTRII